MKQKRAFYYRIIAFLLMLPVCGVLLVSYASNKMLEDVWKQLGVSEQDAKYDIGSSFREGFPYSYSARNAKKIAAGDRVAVAKNVLDYTKQYINSEPFRKEYMQFRDSKKPREPQQPKTKEQVRDDMIKSTEDGIKNLENSIKNTTDAALKKSLENSLVNQKKSLQDYKSPNNEMINIMAKGEKSNYEQQKTRYDEEMAQWETNFPATPQLLAKKRLQVFLELTQGIDYSAALKEGKYGKKVFVNPVYEKKNDKWKMGFRAGKEVTEAVRAFAQQWLKEIQ